MQVNGRAGAAVHGRRGILISTISYSNILSFIKLNIPAQCRILHGSFIIPIYKKVFFFKPEHGQHNKLSVNWTRLFRKLFYVDFGTDYRNHSMMVNAVYIYITSEYFIGFR